MTCIIQTVFMILQKKKKEAVLVLICIKKGTSSRKGKIS